MEIRRYYDGKPIYNVTDEQSRAFYYVSTNGYNEIISDDGEVRRAFRVELEPELMEMEPADALAAVEDDSSWEQYEETVEELIHYPADDDPNWIFEELPEILATRTEEFWI